MGRGIRRPQGQDRGLAVAGPYRRGDLGPRRVVLPGGFDEDQLTALELGLAGGNGG